MPSDKETLARMTARLGLELTPIEKEGSDEPEERVEYDDEGHLIGLNLEGLDLAEIPTEVWGFSYLQELILRNNNLNQLPPEIAKLANLILLDLGNNNLDQLPPEIAKLSDLDWLLLMGNNLDHLPPEIAKLSNLNLLDVGYNNLDQIPSEITKLTNLVALGFFGTQLSQLPPDFTKLSHLQYLLLQRTQLSQLPPDFAKLSNLTYLNPSNTKLRELSHDSANLTNLETLYLDNTPIRTPPPEIVAEGITEIFDFLTALREEGGQERYEAKLLLVGEGRAGKSCLVRRLRGLPCEDLESTHGIEINPYQFDHPSQAGTTITLHAWDFGGQHIYHATHQFFLTQRSLYLVVWNAGVDVNQAGLDKWLKNIQIIAPDSPVFLVATHIDQRSPDVNYQALQRRYPQLAGNFAVSNTTGEGLDALKKAIAETAADLPLMEQRWPQSWVRAEISLQAHPQHHIDLLTYVALCEAAGVGEKIATTTLGGYLHDLGKILYY